MLNKSFFLALFLLSALAAGCVQNSPRQSALENAAVSLKYFGSDGNGLFEKTFEVQKGTNALEAMQQNVQTEVQTFSFGVMMQSINGVAPQEGYYLALYMNGQYAEKGIQEYQINEDTSIEWKTEKIEYFPLNE